MMNFMAITFPVVVCLIAGVASIYIASKHRRFKVSDVAPKSRAHLSREERQHEITIAGWVCWGLAVFWLAGAALLEWLAT